VGGGREEEEGCVGWEGETERLRETQTAQTKGVGLGERAAGAVQLLLEASHRVVVPLLSLSLSLRGQALLQAPSRSRERTWAVAPAPAAGDKETAEEKVETGFVKELERRWRGACSLFSPSSSPSPSPVHASS